MDLQRRKEFTPEYKKKEEPIYKKAPLLDWTRFEANMECSIPYGKYKGCILGDIREDDEKYWAWILDNDIINQWSMYKERKQVKKTTRVNAFYSETGNEYWIELLLFDIGTELAPLAWYRD